MSPSRELQDALLDDQQMLALARYFVEKHVNEIEDEPSGDSSFREFIQLAMTTLAEENVREVINLSQSPIEKKFINSLILGSLKDGCLYSVHRTYRDTPAEVARLREDIASFRKFEKWFKANQPSSTVEGYLDGVVKSGAMTLEERQYWTMLLFKYRYLPLDSCFHMTLQPRFPDVRIANRSIRPDIYFWIPNDPTINIVVECDGFAHHSDRERFINDRKRDRALKAIGYDVLRFSGSEIFTDPVGTAHELAKYLHQRMEATQGLSVSR